ncbi:hypothetical protein [Variovorax sp. J31P179]|uniref:hypothetical protein n=1 Tax=Variovorax sp. J31P179 TaxID=3053508 RepID=UPI0025750556|nr:hypothetical protein [Variovorax sp. J31P179]
MQPAEAMLGGYAQMPADGLLAIAQCLGQRLHCIGHDRPVRCDQIAFIGEDHPSAGTVDQPDADSCFQRWVSLHRANVRQALNHVRRLGRHPPKVSECSMEMLINERRRRI